MLVFFFVEDFPTLGISMLVDEGRKIYDKPMKSVTTFKYLLMVLCLFWINLNRNRIFFPSAPPTSIYS